MPTREIHTDLPRERDALVALLALQVADAHVVVLRDALNDVLDRDPLLFGVPRIAQRFLGHLEGDGDALLQRAHALEFRDRAFEFACVVLDLACDVIDDVFGHLESAQGSFLLQDGDARLVARLLDPRDQTPVEATDEPLFQFRYFARRTVGRQDDLLVVLIQRIERVEKFFLRALTVAAEEVNVVDHQHVHCAEAVTERVHVVVLNRVDELIDEAVAREVEDACVPVALEHALADGLKQMRLPQTDPAVDEQRVVRFAGRIADVDRGSVRQAIARAGDEIIEDVVGVQRQELVAFIEHAALGDVLAMKADRGQPTGHLLCGGGERMLALVLAEVQLCRGLHDHLHDAVGELPRDKLIEPHAMQARMLLADDLKNLFPGGLVEQWSLLRAATIGRHHAGRALGR